MADELGRVELVVEVKTEGLQAQFDAVKTQIESVDNVATINPKIGDKSKFNQQLADIRKQLRSVADYKVGVGYLSLTNAVKEAENLRQKLDSFASSPAEVKVTANLEELNRQIAAVDATLEALKDPRPIQLRADISAIDDAVTAVDRVLEQLRDARPVLLKADTGNVDEAVAAVEAAVNRLRDGGQVPITADIRDALSDIELLNAAIAQERKQPPIVLTTDIRDALSDIELLRAAIDQERRQPAIQVTADTSAAIAELDAVRDLAATIKLPVPLDLLTGDAYADLEKFRSTASQPVKAQLTVEEGNASAEASTLRSDIAETPAALPVDLQTDAARSELTQLRQQAAAPATLPLQLDASQAKTALGVFRDAAAKPIKAQIALEEGNAAREADTLRGQVSDTPAKLLVDLVTDAARTELGALRTDIAKPVAIPLTAKPDQARGVLNALREAAAQVSQVPLQVTADTDDAGPKISAIRSDLNELITGNPYVVVVEADTDGAGPKIEAIQQQLNELISRNPYVVTIDVRQTGISPEEIQRRANEALAGGLSGEALRGTNIAGVEQAAATAAQASLLREELLERINVRSRTQPNDLGNKGLRQFLEATGGLPEGITSKSVRADLQEASRQRLQQLPDQTLLDLAQTLRSINAKLGAPSGAGGSLGGPTPGGNNRSWLDQVARMVLMMAGLDDASIRQQIQQQRVPNVRDLPDLWDPRRNGPLPFRSAQPPGGTPLLTGTSPIERALLRDPVLRDPRRLLGPDGGLDQPQRFEARRRANEQRNATQFQEQRLQSDLANNAARSQRLLPPVQDRLAQRPTTRAEQELKDAARGAAQEFFRAVRRDIDSLVQEVQVRDLGNTRAPQLTGAGVPAGLLPDSTAVGRAQAEAARRKTEEATQRARARSAARAADVFAVPLLPPATGNFDTRRRADTQRRAQELVDAGQLTPRRGETPVRALQREETRRNAAEFRLEGRRYQQAQAARQARLQQEAREEALFTRERQANERRVQARRDAGARRRGDALSNAIIGGAFPALFGQGLGASAGGALGGAVGSLVLPGAGGFAGSLVGTALGAQVDAGVGKLALLTQALNDPIAKFGELQQAALLSSKALEKNVEALIKSGEAEEASARIRQDLIERFGSDDPLGDAPDKLSRELAEVGVAMSQLAAGPLAELAENIRKFIVITGFVFGGKRPERPTSGEQQQAAEAVSQAEARSGRVFSTRFELAQLGGQADTPRNRERAIQLQRDLLELQYQQAFRAAKPEDRLALSRQTELQDQELRAAQERERRQNQRALEDAQLAGGRQIEDAQISLRNDRETLRFIRPEQSGSELAVTTRQEQQALLLNRDRAFQNLTIAQGRGAPPAEIETATTAFKTAQLEYERGVLRSAKALSTAATQIQEQIRGLTRQREDLSTGLAAGRGGEDGLNKFLSPQEVVNRQQKANEQLFAEANRLTAQLGVKPVTFSGTLPERNAQIAEFISSARGELRAEEDIATTDQKLADNMASLTAVNERLAGLSETLSANMEGLTGATSELAAKRWLVTVNVGSGSVGGDARAAQVAI